MLAEDVLRSSENSALKNNQIISSVSGKNIKEKTTKGKGSFLAIGFITAVIILVTVIFGTGNMIPSAISERLIEETDVQYADAVRSKEIVFQQALESGKLPTNTVSILKGQGVLVGYLEDGKFIEGNETNGELVLKIGDNIITADNFIDEVNHNVNLYNAFNLATYSRAAYYYDESAEEVFKKIGTSRNNYTGNNNLEDVMESKLGKGSDINVNSVSRQEKSEIDERTGREVTYYEYGENGAGVNSDSETSSFISEVIQKNPAESGEQSALNSADTLKVADTISKEQRSSLFFLVFMENISKMKAGKGNESEINEAMNFLFKESENEVVDINTGEIIKTNGTAMDSPSLYAVLTGSKVDTEKAENYSSDRILRTIENRLGVNNSGGAISNTVASTTSNIKGSIGRLISSGVEIASTELLKLVAPTVSSSLVNNSYETINGISAGEMLVEGAVNVGKELAKKSGGTAGDSEAVIKYARLNTSILAMDSKADRLNRSPFDITSKNTFLGSIIHNLAMSLKPFGGSVFSGMSSIVLATNNSVSSLLPTSYADGSEGFLTNYGDCETYETIGAVGTVHCSEIIAFDTSTLDDPFNDPGFIDFIEKNTTLNDSGSRTINKGSALARFTIYNNERITPLGVNDGGILESLSKDSESISFSSSILNIIKSFLGADEEDRKIATGESFVNSSKNPDWKTYKYAQRYVSLARATESLRQYADDKSAYNNIKYFEGEENPVIVFLQDYHKVAGN
ncbi:hypothetical protein IJG71_03440 [Candidatus Saccharibacteria bacterium]|nr:hypothetical protein [Candidatus Saccharibacteria bacterium]